MNDSISMAARAASELARGEAIIAGGQCLLAAEYINEPRWKTLPFHTLLSARGSSAISGLRSSEVLALADPTRGKAPAVSLTPLTGEQQTLLALAKHTGLLPALVVFEAGLCPQALAFKTEQLHFPAPEVEETARAQLPIGETEDSTIVSFREKHENVVHLALLIGKPQDGALTRVHSSCVTGDLLGSLRCDCGDQLKQAIGQIAAQGSGVLLYLNQEGRDIGITNKIRAYRLQEMGYDTYEANVLLGFGEDERDFSVAAAILRSLGISRIRLLTNNPSKVAHMEKCKVAVLERVPLVAPAGKHNEAYLKAKAKKFGHQF